MHESGLGAKRSLGMKVFIGLGVLTVLEYIVAIMMESGATPILTVVAVAKAWLILQYFMHVAQLWTWGGDGHD